MTPETADGLLNVLATLIDGYNDLAVKVIAAERVMLRHSPSTVDDYLLEIEHIRKTLSLPAAEKVLAELRARIFHVEIALSRPSF